MLFVIHKTWLVFSLHCITSNYGQQFVSKVYSVLFYKHHNCILYTTACIHIYIYTTACICVPPHVHIPLHVYYMHHSMYIYMYHSMYIYAPQHVYIYIYQGMYVYIPLHIIIHIPQHVYTCNYNEWGMHMQWLGLR